jgi:hypothetical protein
VSAKKENVVLLYYLPNWLIPTGAQLLPPQQFSIRKALSSVMIEGLGR